MEANKSSELSRLIGELELKLEISLNNFGKKSENCLEISRLNCEDSDRNFVEEDYKKATVSEISDLLLELSRAIDELERLSPEDTSVVFTFKVKKHREVLDGYRSELHKVLQRWAEAKRHAWLVSTNGETFGCPSAKDVLLQESVHIQSAERLLDQQLETALSTKECLVGQRGDLQDMQHRLKGISNLSQAANNTSSRIVFHRRITSYILATFFLAFTVLFLLYNFQSAYKL